MSPGRRVVVVGADAAGMSAAHQALRTAARRGEALAVTALEAGGHTSYSACGIPYWMAGDVGSGDDLVARTAEEHRKAGIDLRLHTEVVAADLAARTVTTAAGEVLEYDELVVATGAPAVVPDWALRPDGTTYDGVGVVKTLDDGAAWVRSFARVGPGAHVVVVGAGYVGVEVAEAALDQGFGVTVLTRTRGMGMLEDEMSERVNAGLVDAGVELVLGAEVTGLELDGDRVTGVRWEGGSREADLVVVAIGVRPATDFLVGQRPGDDRRRRAAARPARSGGRPRVGGGRLLRGAPPDRRPVGLPAPRHPRRQARPGARRQPGRGRPVVRRHGRHARSPASPRVGSTSRSRARACPAPTRRPPGSTRWRWSPTARPPPATCPRPSRSPSG